MKSDSGLTMTSLIVYMIAMVIAVSTIATITSFFYTNVSSLENDATNISEITKFHMYFLDETTKYNNSIISAKKNQIVFQTNNAFTFQDNAIYYNQVKICDNVKDAQFSVGEQNSKTKIDVLLTFGDKMEFTRTTTYVLQSL